MKFDYYLFDLDNSLLRIPNPSEYFDNILVETLKQLSTKDIPERQDRNKFWFSGNNYLDLLKNWGARDVKNFWKYFDEIDFNNRKILIKKKEVYLFKDVKKALKEINSDGGNKKTAIISNTADYIVEYIVKKFNIESFFDEIFALSFDKDQALAKPSPMGVHLILKKLNHDPEYSKALMIGDSIVDIYAARRANIHACLLRRNLNKYPNGYDQWEYQPDYMIDSLDELFEL
ncbi:MAG: HAD family hydrolase [Promethearchaeota archaeon]